MKQKIRPLNHFALIVSLAGGLAAGAVQAQAESEALPGGFALGSTLEDAQRHAASRGWTLESLAPEFPGKWKVRGPAEAHMGLFVCKDVVASIHQTTAGDLDDFAKIVTELRMSRQAWDPDINLITFMVGPTRFSNLDVTFAELDGHEVRMQLSSIGGRLALSTNHIKSGQCKSP